MSKSDLKKRTWPWILLTVGLLVLGQVGWWTSVFIADVEEKADLKTRNAELLKSLDASQPDPSLDEIAREAFHRRLMFLSESLFFVLVICVGIALLYRALKAEERAREAERSLIEIVSHESKTPITALKLRLEALRDKRAQDAFLKQEIDLSLQEVRRLGARVSKALTLSRLDRQAFTFETFSLSDLVEEVLHRLDPFFKAKKVEVTRNLDSEALVLGDAPGLQNSLEGLLENAVLYNDRPDKKVKVEVSSTAAKVILRVSDNGPGVDVKEETKIFERFYRGTASRGKAGSGLGLYITKSIVEAHQGMVRLISNGAMGCGFEVELPRVAVSE